ANPSNSQGPGWLGRYLDTLPSPIDPLVGWSRRLDVPHLLQANRVAIAAFPTIGAYAFASPNAGAEAQFARVSATRIASHVTVDRPHVSSVTATAQQAFATPDRVAAVGAYRPAVAYPNNGFGQAMQAVAGAMGGGGGPSVLLRLTR